jgi:O-antigen/teichoic acid export membrane protein
MSGRSGLLAVNVWLAVAVNFGLNIWLVPTYGIEGAAVAWCGSLVVENALGLLQVLRMRVRTHSWDFVPVSALVTGVTLLVALVAERTVGQNWSGVLAAAGGLAVILPIVYFSMRGRLLLKERGADSYDSQSENGEV